MGRPLHLRGPVAGGPLTAHPQGPDVRADRRHRRRADHVASRASGRAGTWTTVSAGSATRRFTLYALLGRAFVDEAVACATGCFGRRGEPSRPSHRLRRRRRAPAPELELPWLPGYGALSAGPDWKRAAPAAPARRGGEVMDAPSPGLALGLRRESRRRLERALIAQYCWPSRTWEPAGSRASGEVRGPKRHFTHSQVMCVGGRTGSEGSRAVRHDGPVEDWRRVRAAIHRSVRERRRRDRGGPSSSLRFAASSTRACSYCRSWVCWYSDPLDGYGGGHRARASTRVRLRYLTSATVEGLRPGEAAFLLCSFWLVDDARARWPSRLEALDALRAAPRPPQRRGPPQRGIRRRARRLVGNFPSVQPHRPAGHRRSNLVAVPRAEGSRLYLIHRSRWPSSLCARQVLTAFGVGGSFIVLGLLGFAVAAILSSLWPARLARSCRAPPPAPPPVAAAPPAPAPTPPPPPAPPKPVAVASLLLRRL